MINHNITDTDYVRAIESGREEAETEFRAQSVRYVADRDALEIVTSRNAGFLIPRQWVGALQDVSIEDLARLEVWPDGSAIEIEDLDIHIGVHGLLAASLPGLLSTRTLAAIFASRGGRATSAVKRSTARENGRRGGRPRKTPETAA
jgi:hypothetical protein